MMTRFALLAATRLSPIEAQMGRLMRSPDEHPAGAAPEAGANVELQDVGGGVIRATPQSPQTGAAFEGAPADPTPKEESPHPEAEEQPKEETPQEETPQAATEEMPPELVAKLEPFTKEMTETGDLSEASVAAAAEAFGVTPTMVRAYVAGLKAEGAVAEPAPLTAEEVAPYFDAAGGAEGYKGFQAWTREEGNMPEVVANAVSALQDAGDHKGAVAMMAPYMAQWKAAGNGPEARDITRQKGAGSGGDSGITGFASSQEQTAAINDPRYKTDAAYRKTVEARMGVTSF